MTASESRLVARDLASGSCAGAVTIAVVHPLDNLRTRMQVLDVTGSPRDVVRDLRRREGGLRALYKGLTVPLVAQGVYKAVIFSTVGLTRRGLERRNLLRGHPHATAALCGFVAGCVNAVVVTPVEMVRNRQMLNTAVAFTTPWESARMAMALHGPLGLFRGLHLTMLRDGVGLACWFAVFQGVLAELKRHPWHDTVPPALMLVAASGGAAGVGFWSVALPLDALKSHVQNGNSARSFFATKGRRYYRGYSVAAPRGLIAAAITFSVQFSVSRWLDEWWS